MYPNLDNNEFLLTDKVSYRFGIPKRGDVIVFKAPKSEICAEIECEYIKRVIGLPGERIMLSKGHFYINGLLLDEEYISETILTNAGSFMNEGVERIIPDGYYLPIGDNRPYSRDGREFGPIPLESIVGKAWVRYYPFNKAGIIKHEAYE